MGLELIKHYAKSQHDANPALNAVMLIPTQSLKIKIQIFTRINYYYNFNVNIKIKNANEEKLYSRVRYLN